MILPVAVLLVGALIVYAGIHDKSVTDMLRTLLGRPASDGPLSSANPSGPVTAGGSYTAAPASLGGNSVSGHPELKPKISQVVNTVLTKFPNLRITSTTGGVHAVNSYHYKGEAADIAGPNMDAAALWIAQNLGSMLTEGIHNPTLSYKDGMPVAPSYWGAVTWAAHTNHIHLAVAE